MLAQAAVRGKVLLGARRIVAHGGQGQVLLGAEDVALVDDEARAEVDDRQRKAERMVRRGQPREISKPADERLRVVGVDADVDDAREPLLVQPPSRLRQARDVAGAENPVRIGRRVVANLVDRRLGELGAMAAVEYRLIHEIKTDDPAGVESYWHRRFADKRMRGEWFKLTAADVRAFKRWKRLY